jgi:hypothetical protein
VRGDDHLEVGDPPDEVGDRRAGVAAPAWKYERTRGRSDFALPDVEHVAVSSRKR